MNELDCGDLVPIRMILTLAACKGQNKRMTGQLVLIPTILDGISTDFFEVRYSIESPFKDFGLVGSIRCVSWESCDAK